MSIKALTEHLSAGEKAMWSLCAGRPGSSQYNEGILFRMPAEANLAHLKKALTSLLARYPLLQSVYISVDGIPARKVNADSALDWAVVNEASLGEEELRTSILQHYNEPFQLDRGPLFRVRVFRRSSGEWLTLAAMHHIVCDGWSLNILFQDLIRLYDGDSKEEPSLFSGYTTFQAAENELLNSPAARRHLDFWINAMQPQGTGVDLNPEKKINNNAEPAVHFELDEVATSLLENLAKTIGCTPFCIFISLYEILLSRYTGSERTIIGFPYFNRPTTPLRSVVGLCVNTLSISETVSADSSFLDLAIRNANKLRDSIKHGALPFSVITEHLRLRNPDQEPLSLPFFISSRKFYEGKTTSRNGSFSPETSIRLQRTDIPFIFHLEIIEKANSYTCHWQYSPKSVDGDIIQHAGRHFLHLLQQVTAQPEQPIGQLQLIGAQEWAVLEHLSAGAEKIFPLAGGFTNAFAQVAATFGDRPAVSDAHESWTYAQLDRWSDTLADILISRYNIGNSSVVGVYLERKVLWAGALLAIWKAGGVYLPLDPAQPVERLRYIVQDAGASMLLCSDALSLDTTIPEFTLSTQLTALDGRNLSLDHSSDDWAYLLYTSGSTGQPKGVMIEHGGLLNHLYSKIDDLKLTRHSRVAQTASHGFDISLWQLLAPLLCGASVHIYRRDEVLEVDSLIENWTNHRITVAQVVPSYLSTLLEALAFLPRSTRLPHLQYLVCAGEELKHSQVTRWFELLPHTPIVNAFGPTEASDNITLHTMHAVPEGTRVPIGRPIDNLRIYLLDPQKNALPKGVVGEICVSGIAVGRGYWNMPEKSGEVFSDDPFLPGRRLYRTGDLGRWNSKGLLEFYGRRDGQVKIRGHRVETAEIERALLSLPGIRQAAVRTRGKDENLSLAAYVVKTDDPLSNDELLARLRDLLPAYMIPEALIDLQVFPLTPSGKIDRRRLPEPFSPHSQAQDGYLPPRTELEGAWCRIWEEVLGKEQVGLTDNFFQLGGNSLKAMRMIAQLYRKTGMHIRIDQLFRYPTIRLLLAQGGDNGAAFDHSSIPVQRSGDRQKAAGAQRLIWVQSQVSTAAQVAYNMSGAYWLEGDFDSLLLQQSVDRLLARHEVLRTRFDMQQGELFQIVDPPQPSTVVVGQTDMTTATPQQWDERIRQEEQFVFDLRQGPLLRVQLLLAGPGKYLLIGVLHHIISDGWSLHLLFRELSDHYNAAKQGKETPLPEPTLQYRDYSRWMEQQLQSPDMLASARYWQHQLDGLPILDLPTDFIRPPQKSFSGGTVPLFRSNPPDKAGIGGAKNEVTDFTMALTALKILLHTYSGKEEILIGIPFHGRTHPDLHNQQGCFVNTLIVKTSVHSQMTLTEEINATNDQLIEAYRNQRYPFDILLEHLVYERDESRSAVFDVFLNYQQKWNNRQSFEITGVQSRSHAENEEPTSKFDLEFNIYEEEDTIVGELIYNRQLFTKDTAEQYVKHFEHIIHQLTNNASARVGELQLVTEADQAELLELSAGAEKIFPLAGGFTNAFAQVAATFGDRPAVSDAHESWTYAQLDRWSDTLAGVLVNHFGIGKSTIVGVYLERKVLWAGALLAIWKAGGVYLPLDPAQPVERLRQMVANAGVAVILCTPDLAGVIGNVPEYSLQQAMADERTLTVPAPTSPADWAYLLYTSGSTGQPKGVMIEHGGLLNHLYSKIDDLKLTRHSRVAQTASHGFDISLWQLLAPLLCGASVHIYRRDEVLEVDSLIENWTNHRITVAQVVPSYLSTLLEALAFLPRSTRLPHLQYLVCAGEELKHSQVTRWFELLPHTPIVNAFGPTEASDNITLHTMHAVPEGTRVPIGRPIDNLRIYLLDPQKNALPKGVVGEICVSGIAVGRGYWNMPEKSGEVFSDDPFLPGRRLYRTGDLGRWNSKGLLEFYGRRDGQVKIRGHRVETAEIERALLSLPGIRQAAVRTRGKDENLSLAAYVVKTDDPLSNDELLARLRDLLPAYMIPEALIDLQVFPLTPSGKIDRRRLPEPFSPHSQAQDGYLPPRTELEGAWCRIWEEVLGKEQVGLTDNFFQLGGNSLKAMRMIAQLYRKTGMHIRIDQLFRYPTIRLLLAQGGDNGAAFDHSSIPVQRSGDRQKAAGAQRLIWVQSQVSTAAQVAYNMSGAYWLEGDFDSLLLQQSVDRLLARHEVLRTRFDMQQGELFQIVDPPQPSTVVVGQTDMTTATPQQWDERIRQEEQFVFDLRQGPLLRVQLLLAGPGKYLLIGVLHHIISDGWSLHLLFRELSDHYNAAKQGKETPLPEPTLQYRDYSRWMEQQLQSPDMLASARYWQHQLDGLPILDLPTDFIRPPQKSFSGGVLPIDLDLYAEKIYRSCRTNQITPSMFLLATLNGFLSLYTGQTDIAVGMPVSGRAHYQLHDMQGMLVNTLIIRTKLSAEDHVSDLIRITKQEVLQALQHESYPLEKIVDSLSAGQLAFAAPPFNCLYNFQEAREYQDTASGSDLFSKQFQRTEGIFPKYDLEFAFFETASHRLSGHLIFSKDIFTETTALGIAAAFRRVAENLLLNDQMPLSHCLGPQPAEQRALSTAIDDTFQREGRTDLFSAIRNNVTRYPLNLAVFDKTTRYTYKEMQLLADGITSAIREELPAAGSAVVGIYMYPSALWSASVWAVLQAGCVCLPIDPSLPPETRRYAIRHSGASLVLCNNGLSLEMDGVKELFPQPGMAIEKETAGMANCKKGSALLFYPAFAFAKHSRQEISGTHLQKETFFHASLLGLDHTSISASFTDATTFRCIAELFAAWSTGAALGLYSRDAYASDEQLQDKLLAERITHAYLPGKPSKLIESGSANRDEGFHHHDITWVIDAREYDESDIKAVCRRWPAGRCTVLLRDPIRQFTFLHARMSAADHDKSFTFSVARDFRVALLTADKRACLAGQSGEIWIAEGKKNALTRTGLRAKWTPEFEIRLLPSHDNFENKLKFAALPLPAQQFQGSSIATELHQLWKAVLGHEHFQPSTGFFEAGGNSLKGIRLLTAIERKWGRRLNMSTLFTYPTIEEQAELLAKKTSTTEIDHTIAPTENVLASASQLRMWTAHQMPETEGAYNIVAGITLSGPLDRDRWIRAWEQLLLRHDSLRFNFSMTTEGLQVKTRFIANDASIAFLDEKQSADLPLITRSLQEKHHDLEHDPLVSAILITNTPLHHICLFSLHHIIADEVSLQILIEDLLHLYDPSTNQNYDHVTQKVIVPEMNKLQTEKAKVYWQNAMAGASPLLIGFADRQAAKSSQTFRGAEEQSFIVNGVMHLRRACEGIKSSAFTQMISCLAALLHRYTGNTDLVITTPFSLRNRIGMERQVGLFLNTLPIRISVIPDMNFTQLVSSVRATVSDAFDHSEYPFESILADQQRNGQTSLRELNIMMVLNEDILSQTAGSFSSLKVTPLPIASLYSKFDLTFHFSVREAEGLSVRINYSTDLFDQSTIRRMLSHFETLLTALGQTPTVSIMNIDYVPADEKTLLLHRFQGHAPVVTGKTVNDFLSDACRRFAERTAIESSHEQLSFEALDQKAGQLAALFQSRLGQAQGMVIGVRLNRSINLVVALAGILRAGASFLPLDKNWPAERTAFVLKDADAACILCDDPFPADCPLFVWNADFDLELATSSLPEAVATTLPESPAYLIYTSGSTGLPKGALISHHGLVNHIQASIQDLAISDADSSLLFTSIGFDSCQTIIWSTLFSGGRLYIADHNEFLDPAHILSWLQEKPVSFIKLTPSHFKLLLEERLEARTPSRLRLIILGGERIVTEDVKAWLALEPNIIFCNSYGPTEATVSMILQAISLTGEGPNTVPLAVYSHRPALGRPTGAANAYVADTHGQLCGIGVPGELYIGGPGVGIGYRNRPELSAQRFVEDPYRPHQRLYRTGDTVKWLNDGRIEFIGRIDNQYKINGYRIELEEIEQALATCNGVGQAAVTVRQINGVSQLLAYVTGSNQLIEQDIMLQLKTKLPGYMIPLIIRHLDSMPLNANGKIHRDGLPSLEIPVTIANGATPANRKEQLLVVTFERVLGQSPVHLSDNFFRLGGDSIKAIQISSRLNKEGFRCEIRDIFSYPVLQDLAAVVTELEPTTVAPGIVAPQHLMPVQSQFFERQLIHAEHFNQSMLLKAQQRVDPTHITDILHFLAGHHDSLRTRFLAGHQSFRQSLEPIDHVLFPIEFHNLTEYPAPESTRKELCDALQKGFDLAAGPLCKAAVFHMPGEDLILLVIHHLIIDGMSWRIILEDMVELYGQRIAGLPLGLQNKTTPLAQWTQSQQKYATTLAGSGESALWQSLVAPGTNQRIPCKKDGANTGAEAETVQFRLNWELTQTARTGLFAPHHADMRELLLACLVRSLTDVFGHAPYCLVLEGHGRQPLDPNVNLSRTTGWFSTHYPIVIELSKTTDPIACIGIVRQKLNNIPANGIGYGMLKYLAADHALPDLLSNDNILFNYLGDFDRTLAQQDSTELFSFSRSYKGADSHPQNHRGCGIRVNAVVFEGSLEVVIEYSNDCYSTAKITAVSQSFERHLHEFIHVLSQPFVSPGAKVIDRYELSPLQQGIYYHWLLDPTGQTYSLHKILRWKGSVDVLLLRKSYLLLLERHPELRTSFANRDNGDIAQLVHATGQPDFRYCPAENASGLSDILSEDRRQGFNLHAGCLIRLTVIRTAPDEYTFAWAYHHIIMDGWSVGILVKEFYLLYHLLLKKQSIDIPLSAPFKSYLEWLRMVPRHTSLRYWEQRLSGYEEIATLPSGKYGMGHASAAPGQVLLELTQQEILGLRESCNQLNVTENTFIQSAWAWLLASYNGVTDVVFGTVVSGRPATLPMVESMIGFFINTIPVRMGFKMNDNVATFLQRNQNEALDALPHHYCSLGDIQNSHALKKHLFDHLLVFENFPMSDKDGVGPDGFGTLTLVSAEYKEKSNFSFRLIIVPEEQRYSFSFLYDSSHYSQDGMEAIAGHFRTVLNEFASKRTGKLADIEFLQQTEQSRLERLATGPFSREFAGEGITSLLTRGCRDYPARAAIVFRKEIIDYQTLDRRTDFLCHRLLQSGIKKGDKVVCCLHRSPSMVMAIFAILKAGAAFIPLDPENPEQRMAALIEDCSPDAIVTDSWSAALFEAYPGIPLMLADQSEAAAMELPTPAPNPDAADLAYIIYTSGSSGKPKGVMISHSSLTNYLSAAFDEYCSDSNCFAGSFFHMPLSFDAAITSLFLPFMAGSSLVIADSTSANPFLDPNFLSHAPYSFLKITPSHSRLLQQALEEHNDKPFETLVIGGEALTKQHLAFLLDRSYPHSIRLVNEYGPTEATVGCTLFSFSNRDDLSLFSGTIPIGKPMPGVKLHVRDIRGRSCAVGVPGEIYVGGAGICAGYLDKHQLSAEHFVTDDVSGSDRLYRTGDWAKWMDDENLLYLGRKDQQVKVRGHRIELIEIEHWLSQTAGVSEAAVLSFTDDDGSPYLAAAYSGETPLDVSVIKASLRTRLPEYMIPGQFHYFATLPLTANGKIHRQDIIQHIKASQSLPSPLDNRLPETAHEIIVAGVFSDIFNKTSLPLSADFYDLGGDSIKAILLMGQLKKKGFAVTLQDILKYPTIAELAARAASALPAIPLNLHPGTTGPLHQADQQKLLPDPSPTQRRLWLVDQLDGHHTVYNSPFARRIKGNIQLQLMQLSWEDLIQRHEVLRCNIELVKGMPKLRIVEYDEAIHRLHYIDLRQENDPQAKAKEMMTAQVASPFDLATSPLFKAFVFHLQNDLYILFINIHHIIIDGWSKRILDEDFSALYSLRLGAQNVHLQEKGFSYSDYLDWQKQTLAAGFQQVHREYWLEKFAKGIPLLTLPTDFPRPADRAFNSRKVTVTLPLPDSSRIRDLAREQRATPFTILLAAVNALLSRYSGQTDIVFGMPVAGRPIEEVHRTVGLFLDTMPGRIMIDPHESFISLIGRMREEILDIFQHQAFSFDQIVNELRFSREPGRSVLFDVMIVSEDFHDEGLDPYFVNAFTVESEIPDQSFSANKYDLTFYFHTTDPSISCTIGYDASLYREETVTNMAGHLINLLNALVSTPRSPVGMHNYLSVEEQEAILFQFNHTVTPYSHSATLHGLFEEKAAASPQQEAVRWHDWSMSYSDLQQKSNAIARKLFQAGARPGIRIALVTSRHPGMIAGLLAILKTGAAYVPIDPRYPAERMEYILTNSESGLILTDQQQLPHLLPDTLTHLPCIVMDDTASPEDAAMTWPAVDPRSLAYVIYTSGSSGQPKGVMIQHHAAVNLIEWVNRQFSISKDDRLLFVTSMCFDLSVYDIFGTLAAGGTIVMITEEEIQNISRLKQTLVEQRITIWDSVPTTLNYLVSELEYSKSHAQTHLRLALVSGDWIPLQLPSRSKQFFPSMQFVSLGGATEATVWSNYYLVDQLNPDWRSIPYGKPIANNFFYILDEFLHPVAIGVTGELYIGGCGVAEGYINDPEKSTKAFLADPFRQELGGRMYKTGDLGRLLPDGNMEFLGRKDFQVKIRGFRVELGETEVNLMKVPGVEMALVCAFKDPAGLNYLVAYYSGATEIPQQELGDFLGRLLPEYMIPAAYVHLAAWPLNENGKIDRKKLPAPDLSSKTAAHAMRPPETTIQKALVKIWNRILNTNIESIDANFFSHGGHSLGAAQLAARIDEELKITVPLRSIFLSPTIHLLSDELEKIKASTQQQNQRENSIIYI